MKQFLAVTSVLTLIALPVGYLLGDTAASRSVAEAARSGAEGVRSGVSADQIIALMHRVGAGLGASLTGSDSSGEAMHLAGAPSGAEDAAADIGFGGAHEVAGRRQFVSLADKVDDSDSSVGDVQVASTVATEAMPEGATSISRAGVAATGIGHRRSAIVPGFGRIVADLAATAPTGHGISSVYPTAFDWFDLA